MSNLSEARFDYYTRKLFPPLPDSSTLKIVANKVLLEYETKIRPKVIAMLEDIYLHEFREVEEIRSLVPEEQWQMYINLSCYDLREQKLLRAALDQLRNVFLSSVRQLLIEEKLVRRKPKHGK